MQNIESTYEASTRKTSGWKFQTIGAAHNADAAEAEACLLPNSVSMTNNRSCFLSVMVQIKFRFMVIENKHYGIYW